MLLLLSCDLKRYNYAVAVTRHCAPPIISFWLVFCFLDCEHEIPGAVHQLRLHGTGHEGRHGPGSFREFTLLNARLASYLISTLTVLHTVAEPFEPQQWDPVTGAPTCCYHFITGPVKTRQNT